MKAKILLLCAGLLLPILCSSQVLWGVTENSSGQGFAIDMLTIEKDGNLVYVWVVDAYMSENDRIKGAREKAEYFGDDRFLEYDSTLSHYVFNIEEIKYNIVEINYYDTRGEVISSSKKENRESGYHDPAAGSVGMALFETIFKVYPFEIRPNGEAERHQIPFYNIARFLRDVPSANYVGDDDDMRSCVDQVKIATTH